MINPNDNLWDALEFNLPDKFSPKQIEEIVAEIPGENDEFNWWWLLKLENDKYILVSGWCDYTGWDCQSGITEYELCDTPELAAEFAPLIENYSNRKILDNLLGQISGKYPKFTYWS
jgi:hypothetical protein